MGGYAVDVTELQQVDSLLEATAAQGRTALAALTSSAQQLFGSRWSSPAASAFRLCWEEWVDAAHDALTALSELASTVGAAGRGYEVTDGSVRTAAAGTPT